MDSDEEEELMMLALAFDEMDDDEKDGSTFEGRKDDWVRSRMNWDDHVNKLQHENLFERKYRMTHRAFQKLVNLLTPYLKHEGVGHTLRKSQDLMVAATIRLLAGGSYLDVYETYGMYVQ